MMGIISLDNEPVIVFGGLQRLFSESEEVPFLESRAMLMFFRQSVLEGLDILFYFLWELHAGGVDVGFAFLLGAVEHFGL